MEIDYEESLKAVRDVLVNFPKQHKFNLEELDRLHKEEIDLLHVIELVSLNAAEVFLIPYKQLQTVLQERRKLKKENEFLERILQLTKQPKMGEKQINQAIGDVRNIKHNQSIRTYRMKARKDLQHLIDNRSIKIKVGN
ncbi:hypothetical protein CIL05_07715 [Virgibacillus profundi]|uniref:Uncharacterized protein n=1 Tax=Virgibacillus profundi TaxID=2024555 RepID=A0A2A2IF18_9BACI|nr:hypothetical protein [Virgibacillus profundi]PAV30349.1 hypothetical protein CIL05_07715 [Virgibacillus profundi]PXY54521.1 hypothetical protein CIT14_07800 [Virgibacillus profundi]